MTNPEPLEPGPIEPNHEMMDDMGEWAVGQAEEQAEKDAAE